MHNMTVEGDLCTSFVLLGLDTMPNSSNMSFLTMESRFNKPYSVVRVKINLEVPYADLTVGQILRLASDIRIWATS